MSTSKEHDKALMCLQFGFFKGAVELGRGWPHVSWLARCYLGGSHLDKAALMEPFMDTVLKEMGGGQGLPEVALVRSHQGNEAEVRRLLLMIRLTTEKQHGLIVSYHPSAILRLARIVRDDLGDHDSAVLLVNCALGHRGVYVSLDDVAGLADLMVVVGAPLALWADWCAIFCQHLLWANARIGIFQRELGVPEAITWAREQEVRSEGVLGRMLERAPKEVAQILAKVARHLDLASFAKVVLDRFSGLGTSQPPPSNSAWHEPDTLRRRYFWLDMVAEHEQHLIQNGDWALFNTPTPDHSMALAQWWRILESVLGRGLVDSLVELFGSHPEWLKWDLENLSGRSKKREAIFIRLADPEGHRRLSLFQLVILLSKCMEADDSPTGSRLRREASKHFEKYRHQLDALRNQSWLNPVHLTQENIDAFRNKPSHNDSVDILDAAVGRLLARRVLDAFFIQVLRQWGFSPAILQPETG